MSEPRQHLLPVRPLRVLSLFSGIGGIDLGLERAGMTVIAHSEVDPYACRVLAKHWPDVPNLGDITQITEWPQADVIAGGFPCTDVSTQGRREGINDGTRSGLWGHFARAIGDVRPRFVIVENVTGLLSLGMGRVLGDLAGMGYDAQWGCVRASDTGAPHRRERIFVIAHAERERQPRPWQHPQPRDSATDAFGEAGDVVDAVRRDALPFVCGRHDGVPPRVARPRLTALGNAVVPAVAEHVGRLLLAQEVAA